MNVTGTIFGQIGAWLANKYVPGIFGKLGIPRISKERGEELKSQKYPKYCPFLYGSYKFLLLTISIGGIFLSIFILEKVQKSLFGENSLYFSSNVGAVIFILLNFFGSILLVGTILGFFYYFLGSKTFRNYLTYQSVKQKWNFEMIPILKSLLVITFIYYLLISPLLYLSLKDYSAFYNDRLVHNSFFSFSEINYPISSINNIKFDVVENYQKDYINLVAYIQLRDGAQIETRGELLDLKQSAKTLGIPIIINQPSNFAIEEISQSCKGDQEEFYDIFELDISIKAPPSNIICF